MKATKGKAVLAGVLLALWLGLILATATYAGPLGRPVHGDDCGEYLKNWQENLRIMPRSMFEDCMRTPNAAAIFNALVAMGFSAAVARPLSQAMAQQMSQANAASYPRPPTRVEGTDTDPFRLTTYPDYNEWLSRSVYAVWSQTWAAGQRVPTDAEMAAAFSMYGPGQLGRFLGARDGLVNAHGTPENVPNSTLGVNPGLGDIVTGQKAINYLMEPRPGVKIKTYTSGGKTYVDPSAVGSFSASPGGAFGTIKIPDPARPGKEIEVIDPKNVAILRG